MSFNWVDLLIVLIVVRGIYIGIKTGLSYEFYRFLALILGYYSALVFHSDGARFIMSHTLIKEKWAHLVAFIGIATIVFLVVIIVLKVLHKIMRIEFAPGINGIGGGIIGGLRSFFIVSLVLLAIFFVPCRYIKKQIYDDSYLGNYAIKYTPRVFSYVSKNISITKLIKRSVRVQNIRDRKIKKKDTYKEPTVRKEKKPDEVIRSTATIETKSDSSPKNEEATVYSDDIPFIVGEDIEEYPGE